MALFNFFGEQEHRVFNYKPIYFDPEKEELKRRFGAVDGSMEKDSKNADGSYKPGAYIKGSFSNANRKRTRTTNRAQSIIGLIGLLLFAIVMIHITKFFELL